ncbi:hypothetical protein G352_13605 [Rhodococcus ruber BKS 20-38]|uniref:Uncharacterized protein n=2 Tax=Rhodococcus ruber TaxID=1830 RepID=M2ZA53_9NOCA|nr:hypothetical protein G352_13605 [Rhodococcus ruber BKS 20-38]
MGAYRVTASSVDSEAVAVAWPTTRTLVERSDMNIIEDTTRAVTRTADLTTAALGAVGGGVVGGTLGAVKGLFQGTAAGLRGGAGLGVLAVDKARGAASGAEARPTTGPAAAGTSTPPSPTTPSPGTT